jgi:TPR repeat protein
MESDADRQEQKKGAPKAAPARDFWDRGWSLYQAGDYAAALPVLNQGGDLGDFDCLETIAYMYDNGLGVPQDHREAVGWYRKAGELGDAKAINELIFRYKKGFFGIQPDAAAAEYWTKKLAEADR